MSDKNYRALCEFWAGEMDDILRKESMSPRWTQQAFKNRKPLKDEGGQCGFDEDRYKYGFSTIKYKVLNSEEGSTIMADLPGVSPENVEVEVQEQRLQISVLKRKLEHKNSEDKETQSFDLHFSHDVDNISVTLKWGVLTVFIPKLKAEIPVTKKIPIQVS